MPLDSITSKAAREGLQAVGIVFPAVFMGIYFPTVIHIGSRLTSTGFMRD